MSKSERLELSFSRALSDLIPTLKDPRIPLVVTVERVHLSKDGKTAKVLVSTLEPQDEEDMLAALNRSAGYLQRQISEYLQTRFTPKLSFHTDIFEVLS
ncbi:MAG: 30S ribosome-binding factor RbfA [Trueperaceae bacterium]|nr:30S ribosome-binding factor RbfA [Trueperaceae bacterium]